MFITEVLILRGVYRDMSIQSHSRIPHTLTHRFVVEEAMVHLL